MDLQLRHLSFIGSELRVRVTAYVCTLAHTHKIPPNRTPALASHRRTRQEHAGCIETGNRYPFTWNFFRNGKRLQHNLTWTAKGIREVQLYPPCEEPAGAGGKERGPSISIERTSAGALCALAPSFAEFLLLTYLCRKGICCRVVRGAG